MKNMKNRISFLMVLVMLFALLAVPVSAVEVQGDKAIVSDAEVDAAIAAGKLTAKEGHVKTTDADGTVVFENLVASLVEKATMFSVSSNSTLPTAYKKLLLI